VWCRRGGFDGDLSVSETRSLGSQIIRTYGEVEEDSGVEFVDEKARVDVRGNSTLGARWFIYLLAPQD
jgi:hypothetical protein